MVKAETASSSLFDVVAHALKGAAAAFGAVCTANALVTVATGSGHRQDRLRAALRGVTYKKSTPLFPLAR